MTKELIAELEQELQRFSRRLRAVKDNARQYKTLVGSVEYSYAGPANAALKRASLDLTKLLAKMRKPQ